MTLSSLRVNPRYKSSHFLQGTVTHFFGIYNSRYIEFLFYLLCAVVTLHVYSLANKESSLRITRTFYLVPCSFMHSLFNQSEHTQRQSLHTVKETKGCVLCYVSFSLSIVYSQCSLFQKHFVVCDVLLNFTPKISYLARTTNRNLDPEGCIIFKT